MKKIISLFLTLLLVIFNIFPSLSVIVNAADAVGNISTSPIEIDVLEKIICTATINENFADDSLLVMLKKDANPTFKTLTQFDFSEVSAKDVKCLNDYSADIAKSVRQIKNSDVQTMAVGGTAAATMSSLSASTGYSVNELAAMEEKFNYIYKIELKEKGKQKVLDAIKELEKRDDVYAVEPNYLFKPCSENNSIETQDYSQQWALDQIDLPKAWQVQGEDQQVLVGVIDSGIQADHPDLEENIDLSLSADFTSAEGDDSIDLYGHGTHVAGIIAANGQSVKGVCDNVTLVNLRVYTGVDYIGLYTKMDNIIDAIDYANRKGIPILNCSAEIEIGFDERPSIDHAQAQYKMSILTAAIESYNGLFVCAAGNSETNIDSIYSDDQYYISGIDHDNILSVTATNSSDVLWSDSNYGIHHVDIAAPGVDILSTSIDGGADSVLGTSFAAPYVAGVAALYMSMYPKPNNVTWGTYVNTVKNAILNTVDKVSSLTDKVVKGGRLNAYSALRCGDPYYKITYNANGGTGIMADTRVFWDDEREIRSNAYTRNNYAFSHWYAKRNCDNKWYYKNYSRTQSGWYLEGQQPSGWTKYRFTDNATVYNLSDVLESDSQNTNQDSSGNSTLTFYAQWTPSYTIVYDANGGVGTMESDTVICGTDAYLRENTFTRSGYVFAGWTAKRSSDNKWLYYDSSIPDSGWYLEGQQPEDYEKYIFEDGESVTEPSNVAGDVVTFYAQWTPSYTIVYDANGGTGTMENTIATYGVEAPLRDNEFIRHGYKFTAWLAKRNADNKWLYSNTNASQTGWYIEGQQPEGWEKYEFSEYDWVTDLESTPGATVTLYAQWEECYRIQFNRNGGVGEMQDIVLSPDDCLVEVPLPACTFTREGYTFVGWHSYDVVCDVWAYSEGPDAYWIDWCAEGEEPEGYSKHVFGDQIEYDAGSPIPTTFILYAVWVEN